MLTADRLRELMTYDPETGLFTYLASRRGLKTPVGMQVAGLPNIDGYLTFRVDMKRYLAHRLAWLWMTGEWPEFELDHKNGVRGDNRWRNLREATRKQNTQNTVRTGVSFDRANNKWQARIGNRHLGRFSTRDEAIAARNVAAQAEYGEFARIH